MPNFIASCAHTAEKSDSQPPKAFGGRKKERKKKEEKLLTLIK